MAIPPVMPFAPAPATAVGAKPPVPAAGNGQFSQVISQLVGDANTQQLQSNEAIEQFASGRSDNIHEVVLAAAKADLSFRLVLEIRNRLIESYQEIMRMQM